ncbi:hypothetical protein LT330_003358 [Penicillium expansum]|nr:hypothetical protein LT330_003358 [Penicillium expansum]
MNRRGSTQVERSRDVFAVGSIIIKSSHLHKQKSAEYTETGYTYADANEVEAIAIAKNVLKYIKVPDIYFNGEVLVLVSLLSILLIAYIPLDQWPSGICPGKASRCGLDRCMAVSFAKPKGVFQTASTSGTSTATIHQATDRGQLHSHVVPDPGILSSGHIQPLEADILFSGINTDPDMSFMHNDFTKSNCIVDNDQIVGLIDWEMASFFGWNTAREVHCTPYG